MRWLLGVIAATAAAAILAEDATPESTPESTSESTPDAELENLKKELKEEKIGRAVEEAAAISAIRNASHEAILRHKEEIEVEVSRPRLRHALDEAAREESHNKVLQVELDHSGTSSFVVWLMQCDFQITLAIAAAIIGLLGVLGPGIVAESVQRAMGSTLIGLLLAGSVSFAKARMNGEGSSWVGGNFELMNGRAGFADYAIWVLITGVAFLRPLILDSMMDEADSDDEGDVQRKTPLLASEAGSQRPRAAPTVAPRPMAAPTVAPRPTPAQPQSTWVTRSYEVPRGLLIPWKALKCRMGS
ncbi:unnamed protein product [Polarella glacialis]|uniref:Uncharacterized protein n=1 Tax=Polarella glacialis TaxID=89957 RepID=A0A813J245_POLGL|nr:unnamed protein product [Polarella glacialis]CAE8662085.1 unnamed protein product [Polarella glacialis]